MDILIHRCVICKCIQHLYQRMGLNESTLGVAKTKDCMQFCDTYNSKLGMIMDLIFTIEDCNMQNGI